MLDFVFTLGQAASAMLLIYGGFLALIPAKKAMSPQAGLDETRLMHLHTDA